MIFTPPPMSLIERSPPGLAFLNRLGEARLERRHVLLEAGRVDVRHVIGDDFQPLSLGGSAFGRDVHSVRHGRRVSRRCAPLRRPPLSNARAEAMLAANRLHASRCNYSRLPTKEAIAQFNR